MTDAIIIALIVATPPTVAAILAFFKVKEVHEETLKVKETIETKIIPKITKNE